MSIKTQHDDLYRVRHSVAHILAQVVLEFFPEAKTAIGPPIREGFYYDFDLPPDSLTLDVLEKIEERIKQVVREGHEFHKKEIDLEEAKHIFSNQPYKLELVEGIMSDNQDEDGNVLDSQAAPSLTIYQHSTFQDLCGGPHVQSTKEIAPDAIKLLSIAGAYWRGDSNRPMLQRVYGTAWRSPKELRQYLKNLEEAKKRDHRLLGKQLDLFSTSEVVGSGLILWHPKGAMVRYLAERFSQEAHLLNGYQWVNTPHIGKSGLWKTSGHLDFYKDSMFSSIDIEQEKYYLKPMNCPFHIQIYKSQIRSYRDLPLRYAEYGVVYRFELSGVLHGLTRVRGFTQDDAHIFCLPEQVEDEILQALQFSLYILRTFGLQNVQAYVSTRPEKKAIGSSERWDDAIATIQNALERENIPYSYDEGGGAFYGPKIDLKVKDSLDREWQLSTIQFDFNLPERFNLEYISSDNKIHTPVMVHRALFGSIERFIALLIEHYNGKFPLWLTPTQAIIIPIAQSHRSYAFIVEKHLKDEGMRVLVDEGKDRLNAKIRNAQMKKINYSLIVGDEEMANDSISVRSRDSNEMGTMSVQGFLDWTREERDIGIARVLI